MKPPLATYWRLGPAVTACLGSGRILFLDVARDRYLALPAELTGAFTSWLETPGADLPQACRLALEALQLSDAAASRPQRRTLERVYPIDAEPLAPRPVTIGHRFAIGRAVMSAWRDVRKGPLDRVLVRWTERSSRRASSEQDLETRLAIFRSVRPSIPVPRVCLHDCLALMRWIAPAAGDAALVFGVSASPFAAHCWVQTGGRVLDDHPESPSRFAPILHLP